MTNSEKSVKMTGMICKIIGEWDELYEYIQDYSSDSELSILAEDFNTLIKETEVLVDTEVE